MRMFSLSKYGLRALLESSSRVCWEARLETQRKDRALHERGSFLRR
jgi:hypothetical protein